MDNENAKKSSILNFAPLPKQVSREFEPSEMGRDPRYQSGCQKCVSLTPCTRWIWTCCGGGPWYYG